MKSPTLIFGLIFSFLYFFSSCDKVIELLEEDEVTIEIPYSQTSWEIGNNGEIINVDISVNDDWSVKVEESSSGWISVSPTWGSAGEHKLEISVSANETEEQRVGTVTIVSQEISKSISIKQEGLQSELYIPESQTSWEIGYEESIVEVDLKTNSDWSVDIEESASSWISVSVSEGSAGEHKLEISVSANETEEQRVGTVTIVSQEISKSISIKQEGLQSELYIPESQTSWEIGYEESIVEVDLKTNSDWSVDIEESASSWISVSVSEGSAGEHKLEISVSANETEEQRVGAFTVIAGKLSEKITIKQNGKVFQPEGEGPEDMPIEEWK